MVRGCFDNSSEKLHNESLSNAKLTTCLTSHCNNKNIQQEYCVTCDSEIDSSNCSDVSLAKHTKACSLDFQPLGCYHYEDNESKRVQRGCVSDVDEEKRKQLQICSSNDDGICIEQTNTCVICDSNDDKNCMDHPKLVGYQTCGPGNSTFGCYLRITDNHAKRGCIQALPDVEKVECLNQSESCKTCFSQNCNEKINFQSCYNCNSKDDSHCSEISEFSEMTVCPNYMDKCATGIDAKGYTVRRCSKNSSTDELDFSKRFEICNESDCNRNIFPTDRLRCFQCEESSDFECQLLMTNSSEISSLPIQSKPCRVLSQYDKCYTFISTSNDPKSVTLFRLICKQSVYYFHNR